ncbi:site-specific integrase [Ferribacterium limneticum]|uniref:site-specific integrase n=1 Tax=Ferribacterium limneticum TaxID=76259 RepID=UPI001CF9BE96|nr:site-specific integrase [Ferribacterium limneticum]UCV26993.1 site-specific integrase [Ferribacterium limneticum]UCV30910.1 site-specific integrase [Ferribacterium limneticum]
MAKLTKVEVDNLKPSGKDAFVWADDPKGFGVKVFTSGVKSFVFQYRTEEGKTRRYTIGKLSDTLTVEQARKRAKALSLEVLNGGDPMGHKQARLAAITVAELLTQYQASPKFAENAETTKATDKGRIERHLIPLLGDSIADKISADDVRRAQAAIRDGKTAGRFKTGPRGLAKVTGGAGTADKCVLLLRAAYAWAISENILKDNPAAPLKVAGSGQREQIMETAADYTVLFNALDKMQKELRIRPAAADAIRLIALTGARRGEVSNLIWQYCDLRTGLITLPPKAHKAGKRTGKPRIIALPAEGVAILKRQAKGKPEDYVFKPAKGDGAIALAKPWIAVREEAKLPANFGLHGLRHSLGSHLAMSGASSHEVMEALGHRQASTTQRYIHFAERARSTLAERAASVAMAGMVSSKASTEPLPE